MQDKHDIAEVLGKAINWVSWEIGDTQNDYNIIYKSMIDSGISQGIFLVSIDRENEFIKDMTEPLPLRGMPIYVNIYPGENTNRGATISGNIYAFGYNIDLTNVPWYSPTVEEVEERITLKRN